MTRIALADGRWFDTGTATRFGEDTWWDGNNQRSTITGSQWDHQELFYTRHGGFILRTWSQWEGVPDTVEEVGVEEATTWLVRNLHFDDLDKLPADVREQVAAGIARAEV